MDTCPQEIVDRIVWFATDSDSWRQLLTVSRPFQVSVEKYQWTDFRYSETSDMEEFLNMYRGYRCRYLRNITLLIGFPFLEHTEENPVKCRETAADLKSHNERFTRQISGLFAALKVLEEREHPHNRPRGICLSIESPHQLDNNEKFCHHHRYHSWRLCLLDPQDLPIVSSIRKLEIRPPKFTSVGEDHSHVRPLDLGLVPALISKLPNLEDLDGLYLYERFPEAYEYPTVLHFVRPWEGPWRDTRHAFGSIMLNSALPTKLRNVKLYFGEDRRYKDYTNQSLSLPDFVKPLAYDPLSSALRVFSQRVVNYDIRGCFDSTLFWPASGDLTSEPHWPYLKNIRVEFNPVSPSGVWFFRGPQGEGRVSTGYEITQNCYPPLGENEEDERWDEMWNDEGGRFENFNPIMFRIIPNDEVIEPFLEMFAKAMKNMPSLETAELFTRLDFEPGEELEDKYPDHEEGEEERFWWGLRYRFSKDGGNPVLEWRVGDWRPSERLLKSLHDVGHFWGGKRLEEKWLDWAYVKHDYDPWDTPLAGTW